MSKTYKIKVNQGPGEAKLVDIPQAGGGTKPLAVKAVPGGKYQLVDGSTGFAPENIRATRSGKNLQVFFEGRGQADLVIEDYYEVTPEGFNGLIGEAESGRFYEYIPETAVGQTSVPLLADGSNQIGMALGGAEINASGAAVGALVAAAGLNPLLLAPLALLGAAGGGGGGGAAAATDTTAPVIKSAKLHVDDDSGAKDNVTNDKTPRLVVETEANADVAIELNGKTYTGKADANGLAVIQVPDTDSLKDGSYDLKVTATDAAKNKSPVFDGTPFTVDNSGTETNPNKSALIEITKIDIDSGSVNNDFYTNDNQLLFSGTVKSFTQNGDWIKLDLKNANSETIATTYVRPTAPQSPSTDWTWSWDRNSNEKIPDGKYTLIASVVDGADNVIGNVNALVMDSETIIIDTDKENNFEPTKTEDPNKSSVVEIVSVSEDTGHNKLDFITKDRTHVYTGKLSAFTSNGASVELTLKDSAGKVVANDHVVPKQVADVWTWSWDQSGNSLPDGEYSLIVRLVDKAGNPMQSDVQAVIVDNSASDNGGKTDPNSTLKMLPITFNEDTGVSQTDYLTNDQFLTFKGGFDKDFVKNGDRVLVQVFGSNGLVISEMYVDPTGKNWEFDNLTKLGVDKETRSYTVKSVLVDAAGNTLKATDQSFVIDKSVFINDFSDAAKQDGLWTFKTINYSTNERGSYKYTTGTGIVEKTYDGGLFDLIDLAGKKFEKGTFSLEFKDLAGNVYVEKNTDQVFDFTNASMATGTTNTLLPVPGFNGDQLVGSVGKLVVGVSDPKEIDMATLYDGIADLGNVGAINHVDLIQGDRTLKLTMGDVLDLGVKNSFTTATAHKDHLQLRIDGDAADKVVLDDLVGTIDYDWNANQSNVTLDGQSYKAFTHEELGLSLFVNVNITQLNQV